MKTAILRYSVLALAMLTLRPGIAAQKGKAGLDDAATKLPVELILTPDHLTVAPHGKLALEIKWINHSHKVVWCSDVPSSSKIDESYLYDIRTSEGKRVPRMPGKGKENITLYPENGGDLCTLAPGASIDFFVGDLLDTFQMNKPGEYTVRLSLPDPGHPGQLLGRSNVVTITVKAPQAQQ